MSQNTNTEHSKSTFPQTATLDSSQHPCEVANRVIPALQRERMGKVGGSVEDGVWDRAGAAMEAEGAVVWLAASKQRSCPLFNTPCCKHKPPHVHKAK